MIIIPLLLALASFQAVTSQRSRPPPCDATRACYPATGDLLVGRHDKLASSSTCGLSGPERFCIVSHLEEPKKCFVCDSRGAYRDGYRDSHRIENIVSLYEPSRWKRKWWQAENGLENVHIQLDLEAEFHFTHLVMRFKTFRPAGMIIEKSHDFGRTWKVYRYFAYNCRQTFPSIPTGPVRHITDVICESRYSDVAPSTEGEVVFRALPPSIEIQDPYSEEVQDLLKMTNLRINFTKLHTLGDDKLDSRIEVKEKYYYALYDMVVRGSCSCYGHASRCVPLPGQELNVDMVHGQCECTHNTKGLNCELCEDFYNDVPWRPAHGGDTNICQKCECNNHATRCHFDPAVYEATGRVSGGVCDECQHNTMGRNCEECKPFYYQDPNRDIRDPYVCQPCHCDPVGSEHSGECESRTDPQAGLVAGRCICKRYVEGQRCDTCRNGYWNLQENNPEGCQSCSCNTLGTVGNYGCDKRTGTCRCKRFVTGRECDECSATYWGLGNEVDGCKACDCDVGGAYDNNCDQRTGQCKCRPNIIGRRCDQPSPGYFVTNLDYLMYEGEFAKGSANTRMEIRQPLPGRQITWTGPGFMRVLEGETLEFLINNIPMSMEYDIVIRYEPQMPDRWEDVRVIVERPGLVDQRGPCANSIPQDDYKSANLPQVPARVAVSRGQRWGYDFNKVLDKDLGSGALDDEGFIYHHNTHNAFVDKHGNYVQEWTINDFPPPGSRHYVVAPSSCLETGVTYRIRLEFNRYAGSRPNPAASVLIDSIVLMPSTDSIPIFQGPGIPARMKEEFNRNMCRDLQMSVIRPELPEACKKLIFSISAVSQDKALECMCDPTGSTSTVCASLGGQCPCKQNVIGRQCDQCAPGTYGFGPQGCLACNCNAIGSRDNMCEVTTGQCVCVNNVFGRQCDQCQRSYWGFPQCRQCECNGRADTCDNGSGRCIDCRDNTGGEHCEMCASGYYGDPRPGSPIGCRACRCPGGTGSGYQHGDTCRLDTRTNQVVCDCRPGYAGNSCDRCEDNYYGNPLVPGGTCESCSCNGNIDINVPGSCDANTGECLRCLFNTEGFSCERCRDGYYGDATQHNCQECVCNLLGHDQAAGQCDIITGQCPCLPNVIGQRCDRCSPNFWKIASGTGCEPCYCDPQGSLSTQCNEFDGQCQCKRGRGGRDCSECEDYYWGDPLYSCRPCNCDSEGSATRQCDRRTGTCVCIEGVTGPKCDRCDRGTTGQLPYCLPCGECFDNWDRIIMELRNETHILIEKGSKIKVEGALGAFEEEFEKMEDNLRKVEEILANQNVTEEHLDDLSEKLNQIRSNLTDGEQDVDKLDEEIQDTADRIETANKRIDALKGRVDKLKDEAQQLRDNATAIKEEDVAGAFNSTRDSLRRSRAAQRKVDYTERTLDDSKNYRDRTDDLIDRNQDEFDRLYQENELGLDMVKDDVERIDDKIVDLNEIVCGGRGDPCDELCGGAGCGKCGGSLSCDTGAVTKASNALDLAKDAEETLDEKAKQAQDLLDRLNMAAGDVNMAKGDTQMAWDRAWAAKNESEGAKADLEDILRRITEFLATKGARPANVRAIAEEVLAMTISLTPEEIRDLAKQINQTIAGLTNIDDILDATKEDLEKANDLKDRADDAKDEADRVLEMAQDILEALRKAKESQDNAEIAIGDAEDDIRIAEGDILQIESETSAAHDQSNQTLHKVYELQDRLGDLKEKYTENEINVEKAEREAMDAEDLATMAEEDANELETKYQDASEQLEQKYNETVTVKKRADDLRDRASKLYQDTNNKLRTLRGMENEFDEHEQLLKKLDDQMGDLLRQMVVLLADVQMVAKFHRECA